MSWPSVVLYGFYGASPDSPVPFCVLFSVSFCLSLSILSVLLHGATPSPLIAICGPAAGQYCGCSFIFVWWANTLLLCSVFTEATRAFHFHLLPTSVRGKFETDIQCNKNDEKDIYINFLTAHLCNTR